MRLTTVLTSVLVLALLGMVSATAFATTLEASDDSWGMRGYYNETYNADANFGDGTKMVCKWTEDTTWCRKSWTKFDLSGITETMVSATFQVVKNEQTTGDEDLFLNVYALNDGDVGEGWDEMTITYNNAPANVLDENEFDPDRTTYVGSVSYNANDPVGMLLEFSSQALLDAVNGDTDGQLSLFFRQTPDSGYSVAFASRENETYAGATLHLAAPGDLFKPGDADMNGTVDAADASTLAANWQMQSGADWTDGDFNGDNMVNNIDATLLAANWTGPPATVPEPSTLMALAGLLLGILIVCKHTKLRKSTNAVF